MFSETATPISAPDQLDLSAPLHVDAGGFRSWRMRSGWLEPVRHRLAVRQGDAPLWRFLIDHQDHRHIHLTGGAWLLSDIGMARLAHLGAGDR